MKPTQQQKEILNFVKNRGKATTAEICEATDRYFTNGAKHVGERLSRMVKAGMLVRLKKGVYACGDCNPAEPGNENQTELFR